MNQLREDYIADAVQRAGSPITVEFVSKFLPEDFKLTANDLKEFQPAEAEPAPEAERPFDWAALNDRVQRLNVNGAAPEAEPEAVAEPAPPATADDIEAATLRRIAADSLVANARVAVISASNVERAARIKLGNAVTQFQSGFAPVTPEQLRRDFVREQQAIRAGIADGSIAPPPRGVGIGKSTVDRVAYAQRGGSHQGNFRRGASTVKGMPNFDPRKGPVAKLPSQR